MGDVAQLIIESNYLSCKHIKEFRKDLKELSYTNMIEKLNKYFEEIEQFKQRTYDNMINKIDRRTKEREQKNKLNKLKDFQQLLKNEEELQKSLKIKIPKVKIPGDLISLTVNKRENKCSFKNGNDSKSNTDESISAVSRTESVAPVNEKQTNPCRHQVPENKIVSSVTRKSIVSVSNVESAHKTEESSGKSGLLDVKPIPKLSNPVLANSAQIISNIVNDILETKTINNIFKYHKIQTEKLKELEKDLEAVRTSIFTKAKLRAEEEEKQFIAAKKKGIDAVFNHKMLKVMDEKELAYAKSQFLDYKKICISREELQKNIKAAPGNYKKLAQEYRAMKSKEAELKRLNYYEKTAIDKEDLQRKIENDRTLCRYIGTCYEDKIKQDITSRMRRNRENIMKYNGKPAGNARNGKWGQ
jgi:hypothetical protein